MKRHLATATLLAAFTCSTGAAFDQNSGQQESHSPEGEFNQRYGSDPKTGYWWRDRKEEKTPLDPKQQPHPEEIKNSNGRPQEVKKPIKAAVPREKLWEMSTEDMEEYIKQRMSIARSKPTEENVVAYYEAMDVARLQAQAFANVSQYVWQKHPELSTIKDFPITIPGRDAFLSQKTGEIERVLLENREEFALLFFTKPACEYCSAQQKINSYFSAWSGWKIKPVDISAAPHLVEEFKLSMLPSLVLIQKDNPRWHHVAAGVVSVDDLKDRAYRAIRIMRSDLTPEDYSGYNFNKGGGFDPTRR